MRETGGATDGLDRDALITRRTSREPAPFDIGRRSGGIVAERLLLLLDVCEAEVATIILVENVVQPERGVRNGLGDVVDVVEIRIDERVVRSVRKRRRRIQSFCRGLIREIGIWLFGKGRRA